MIDINDINRYLDLQKDYIDLDYKIRKLIYDNVEKILTSHDLCSLILLDKSSLLFRKSHCSFKLLWKKYSENIEVRQEQELSWYWNLPDMENVRHIELIVLKVSESFRK